MELDFENMTFDQGLDLVAAQFAKTADGEWYAPIQQALGQAGEFAKGLPGKAQGMIPQGMQESLGKLPGQASDWYGGLSPTQRGALFAGGGALAGGAIGGLSSLTQKKEERTPLSRMLTGAMIGGLGGGLGYAGHQLYKQMPTEPFNTPQDAVAAAEARAKLPRPGTTGSGWLTRTPTPAPPAAAATPHDHPPWADYQSPKAHGIMDLQPWNDVRKQLGLPDRSQVKVPFRDPKQQDIVPKIPFWPEAGPVQADGSTLPPTRPTAIGSALDPLSSQQPLSAGERASQLAFGPDGQADATDLLPHAAGLVGARAGWKATDAAANAMSNRWNGRNPKVDAITSLSTGDVSRPGADGKMQKVVQDAGTASAYQAHIQELMAAGLKEPEIHKIMSQHGNQVLRHLDNDIGKHQQSAQNAQQELRNLAALPQPRKPQSASSPHLQQNMQRALAKAQSLQSQRLKYSPHATAPSNHIITPKAFLGHQRGLTQQPPTRTGNSIRGIGSGVAGTVADLGTRALMNYYMPQDRQAIIDRFEAGQAQ